VVPDARGDYVQMDHGFESRKRKQETLRIVGEELQDGSVDVRVWRRGGKGEGER